MESFMKKLIAVLVLALTATAGAAQAQTKSDANSQTPAAGAAKAHKLTRSEFDGLLATPDRLVVLDVRRPDELTTIGGFPVYLSIQLADLEKYAAFIPKDRTVVTVSNHAGRAARAADLLASKGFKVAGAIGAQDYEAQGGHLTKIAPKQPAGGATASAARH
jgi:rhodanese-related sulfurtransferase